MEFVTRENGYNAAFVEAEDRPETTDYTHYHFSRPFTDAFHGLGAVARGG